MDRLVISGVSTRSRVAETAMVLTFLTEEMCQRLLDHDASLAVLRGLKLVWSAAIGRSGLRVRVRHLFWLGGEGIGAQVCVQVGQDRLLLPGVRSQVSEH